MLAVLWIRRGHGLLIVIMVYVKVPHTRGWLFLPLILITQILLVLGIGWRVQPRVCLRDVQSVLSLVVQLWFYASPIIYPVSAVPERFRAAYFLNPMAGILERTAMCCCTEGCRGPRSESRPHICLCFLVGYWFFKRTEFVFADIV
jgi:lipopolysaccharide transport system permease protein